MENDIADDILNMYKLKKPINIPMSHLTNQRCVADHTSSLNFDYIKRRNVESERDYIKEYKQKDDEDYLKLANISNKNYSDNMSDITVSIEEEALHMRGIPRIYQTYNFAYRPKINLPILSIRNEIVSMIANNPVVIIRGSTGCGKTTQIPQLILDAEFEKKQHCNIIVTQPRRIAALSIAKRVSYEREWPVGTLVGYQMGLIKNTCYDTCITYCTTGVLLHKFINKKHMMDYTHVILDEVHERDEDMDFLLLVVKKLLRSNSSTVKVILMSATINVDKFAAYFSTPVENKLLPAPVINIPQGNPYDIFIYYLDEMENLGNIPKVFEHEPSFTTAMAEFCIRIIHVFDGIDKKSNEKSDTYERYTVLIFLPGILEIEELRIMLLSPKYETKWDVIILHSLISTEDQENIFKKVPKGYRRIILSTNIAESSVTVPDVKYVIDFCLTKLLVTESETNYECLQLCWASKSNCQQRAGRTGRVTDGRVYRMVPRQFYDTVLRDEALPEMLRAPLANVILKTKMLDMGKPKALLALSLDPPNLSNLRNTILLLKEAGALLNKSSKNEFEEFDGDLTPLGRVMASLPLNIYLSKLIVLGHIFGVLHDAIIIAASMSVKDMFNIAFHEKKLTYYEKLNWAAHSDSDSIACLNAFKVWRNDKANRRITSAFEERKWARQNGLRVKTLREIDALVTDITSKLHANGVREYISDDTSTWENRAINRTVIIKLIIAGAFYPNYFIKFSDNMEHRQKEITKMLSNRDSTKTVILRGWPLKQPGSLYSKRFQEIFAEHMGLQNQEDITVSFDGSSRVYIEYEKSDHASDNYSFVKQAIKMRQCRVPLKIDLLSENEAFRRANELGLTNVFEHTFFLNEGAPSHRYMYDKKPYPELPEEYQSKVMLRGPFSPIETRLIHLTAIGMSREVRIDATSVNSVLLDTYPSDSKGPLIVAQTITRDCKGEMNLIIRNTTLLPDIPPGFASLIILIFTPYMELRRNPLGTHYTGALCGLGYNPTTGESIFPEHDLENIFDIEITIDDLKTINKLRHWMNVAMHFSDDTEDNQVELTLNCQERIHKAFEELIYKTRKKQVPILTTNFHKWKRYKESLFLEPARETSRRCHIYGLHKALELNERNDELENMIKHLLELEILAHRDPREMSIKPISCKLCLMEINGIIELRAHLCSEQHITKQKVIDTTDEFGEDLQSLLTNMRL